MNILFVCTGNTCRSPMAEGLFNHYAAERGADMHAFSAGLLVFPGSAVTEKAVAAAAELGADISGHVPRRLTGDIIADADLILTMSAAHKTAVGAAGGEVYTLKEYIGESGDISDPYGGSAEVYRSCAREISSCVIKVLEKLEK